MKTETPLPRGVKPYNTPGRSGKWQMYWGRKRSTAARINARRQARAHHGKVHAWQRGLPLPQQGGRK